MAKVTSKLQVTVPKAVADRFGIRPGDEIDWVLDGDAIRVLRAGDRRHVPTAERLKIFDAGSTRQAARDKAWRRQRGTSGPLDRGWTRDEIYTRGRAR